MMIKEVTIQNPSGIHAIYAAQISQLCHHYKSDVFLRKGKQTANARSLMSMLGLCVRKGETLKLMVDGIDEAEAMAAVFGFLENLSE